MITEIAETAVLTATVEELWSVVSDTSRYADWVDGCLEVTEHHGTAVVGGVYRERNRTVGPLTTCSTWTVLELVPMRTRTDRGVGFFPLNNLQNTFTFQPADDGALTIMTYQVRFTVGLGPVGSLLRSLQEPVMRASFQHSMRNLERLIISERAIV
jgi:ribosome-associated toxin RatA of RatAB toxin-antitoxin module